MRDSQGVDPNRRGSGELLGGIEGGKTIFQLYCRRKECIVNLWLRN